MGARRTFVCLIPRCDLYKERGRPGEPMIKSLQWIVGYVRQFTPVLPRLLAVSKQKTRSQSSAYQ